MKIEQGMNLYTIGLVIGALFTYSITRLQDLGYSAIALALAGSIFLHLVRMGLERWYTPRKKPDEGKKDEHKKKEY